MSIFPTVLCFRKQIMVWDGDATQAVTMGKMRFHTVPVACVFMFANMHLHTYWLHFQTATPCHALYCQDMSVCIRFTCPQKCASSLTHSDDQVHRFSSPLPALQGSSLHHEGLSPFLICLCAAMLLQAPAFRAQQPKLSPH